MKIDDIINTIKNISENEEYSHIKNSYNKLEKKIEDISKSSIDDESLSNKENIDSMKDAIEYIKNKFINNEDTN